MTSAKQKIKWRIEAAAYDIISAVIRIFPLSVISAFGGWLVRLIGPLTSKHKIARTGLRLAFPEKSEAEIKQLLAAQWDNTGRTFAEFPLSHRIKAFGNDGRVAVEGLEIFQKHAPAITLSGHFANWEVMATALTQSGLPVRITYRKINNPHIDARVIRQREAYGTKFLVQKATHKSGRELLTTLKNGESIAILNDQKFNTGISVPFFGHGAMTAQGAVRLAIKTGRPLLPMCVVRDKARFKVKFYPPINLVITGEREADTRNGVIQITKFIEARIHENPAQWFWVHRRWPKEIYKNKEIN